MNIVLLGEPPTVGELAKALREVQDRAHESDKRRFRFAAIVVAGALLCGIAVWWLWGPVFGGATGLATVYIWVTLSEREPTLDQGEFEPINSFLAGWVLEACELDPRVDVYRRKVVEQGRDLTVLEARAFNDWKERGYEASRRLAAVRSSAPLSSSAADAG